MLAIEFWIPAFQALLAHVNLVLHAEVLGFPFRVVVAFSHGCVLLNRLKHHFYTEKSVEPLSGRFPAPDVIEGR